jgi:hypothetical protein
MSDAAKPKPTPRERRGGYAVNVALFVTVVFVGLAAFVWASDRITLEGERTIYTVACEQGAWDGLRCTGRIKPAERYRFRASRSRQEIVYWIAGSRKPSGKYTDCEVTDRDRWTCKASAGDLPTIAHELSNGKPVQRVAGADLPFHAVHKWKWWAMDLGIPGFGKADFDSASEPPPADKAPTDAGPK